MKCRPSVFKKLGSKEGRNKQINNYLFENINKKIGGNPKIKKLL